MTEKRNCSADKSSVKQIVAFAILVSLVALSFSHPVVFGSTIDLSLYSAIPLVFWFALTYGLVFPFVTKWLRSPKVFKLWGTVVYSLYWSYFTVVEPELRYPDAYVHSRTTLLLAAHGVAPSVERYLLWPNSFILQDITSQITGLPLLAISRILAVVLVGLIGLLLMNIFSLFFEDPRKSLLCLFVAFIFPNTLMLNTQHYSPQLLAYVIALLAVFVIYRETTNQTGTSIVLIFFLGTIVLSNPTTTVWIAPILLAIWIFKRTVRNSRVLLLSSFIICLYLVFAAIWSIQPEGLSISESLLVPFWQKFLDMLTVGRVTLSEGLFRPSYQPFFSLVIRRFTFVLLGILLVPSTLLLVRRTLDFVTRKARFLDKFDAFALAVVLGSLVGTVFFWVGTGGGFGDRTWGILVPVLAALCIESISAMHKRRVLKIIALFLTALLLILIPLNFVASNYSESLNQTTSQEMAAVLFVSEQDFHNERLFCDNLLDAGRFTYAMPDPSNVIFSNASYNLDPMTVANETLLAEVHSDWPPYQNWTMFVHSTKTELLMYTQFGLETPKFQGFYLPGINRFYDNGEIVIYKR